MADPVLHVIDSYYFEVPQFLWEYKKLDQIPGWLREANPSASIQDFQHELNGKIVIPQPFGKLKDLYTAESGFCISKYMILEVAVAAVLVFLFSRLAAHVRSNGAPQGRLWNLLESFLVYLRDGVIRPSIDGDHADHDEHGDHPPVDVHVHAAASYAPAETATTGHGVHGHAATGHSHARLGHAAVARHPARESDKFVPILWTLFFFVLFCNLAGIIPWLGSPTGALSTTVALAVVTLLTGFIFGNLKFGVFGYWKNQIPSMDLPLVMAIILKPMIFVIEVAGLLIKHGILAVRLLANMLAGHLVIGGIMGLIVAAAAASDFSYWVTTIIAVIGTTLFFLLELFVAFLQAYIFTFLSALFIGAAVHHH